MDTVVTRDREVMHGTPCFAGTRVPVKSLFDHLDANYSVDEFIDQFPTVRRAQVVEVLRQARDKAERDAVVIGS